MNPIYDNDLQLSDIRFTLWQRIKILFSREITFSGKNGWNQIYAIAIEPLEKDLAECYRLATESGENKEYWEIANRVSVAYYVRELRYEHDRLQKKCAALEALEEDIRSINTGKFKKKSRKKK